MMDKQLDIKVGECITIEKDGEVEELYVFSVDAFYDNITFRRIVAADRKATKPRAGQFWYFRFDDGPEWQALVQYVGKVHVILEVRLVEDEGVREEWTIEKDEMSSKETTWFYMWDADEVAK